MSIPEEATEEPRDPVEFWVRALIPAAVALVILAVLIAEPGPARFDLQIVAPRAVVPGAAFPVRAHVMTAGDDPPQVVAAPIAVDVRRLEGGEPLAEARLNPSAMLGVEGELRLPPTAEGLLLIRGRALVDDEEVFVWRRLRVALDAPVQPRRGRLQTDLQRYALGPVEGSAPPDRLDARVVGGDCSAPEPCAILVWVGRPAAAVRLADAAGAEVVEGTECDGRLVSTGVLQCAVRTNNNEASLAIVAYRDGQEVGRRTLQLPMGSAAPTLDSRPAVTPARLSIDVARRYDEGPVIVDLFREGRWRHSTTYDRGEHVVELDGAGLWRIQARSDPFGGDAATRLAVVAVNEGAALDALAQHERQRDWQDPMAVAIRRGDLPCPQPQDVSGPCAAARWVRFMLAAGELEVASLPTYTSGAAQANAGLHDRGQRRRAWAAALIVVAGLFVAIVVVRRGLRATRQAERLLDAVEPGHHQRRWTVWASGAFVTMVFVAAALLVLSRGCL